jgi:GNAT superfamily N-acetyltransferase
MKFRTYKETDRKSVEEICIATGLNGNLNEYFDDEKLFANLWLSAYLDGQPENTIIVEDNDEVVGYLVACYGDYKKYLIKYTLKWYLILLFKYLTGQFKKNKFPRWCLFYSLKEMPRMPKNSAHFHFNLKEKYRNKTIGPDLIKMFENNCKQKNLTNWYVITFINNERRSLRAYERWGLKLYDKKKCRLYEDSYSVCLVKQI